MVLNFTGDRDFLRKRYLSRNFSTFRRFVLPEMKSLHLRFFRSDMAKFADSGDLVSAKKA